LIKVNPRQTAEAFLKKAKAVNRKVNRALKVGAMELALEMKKSIHAHKSMGREYRRRSVTHTASMAGYPPNSDTGYLANSITPTESVRNSSTYVIVGAKYARALEFGARRRKLKPRPFVRPARQKTGFKIYNRIKKAMNDAL